MGSIESKNQNTDNAVIKGEEQQENGHVKTNGDTLKKPTEDTAASNGSAVAEEVASGETIEQAPPVNGDAKPEEPPGKQAKKKRFSFKKQFKLPFRKTKKEAEAAEEPPAGDKAASPKEENSPEPAEEKAEEVVTESTNPPADATLETAAAATDDDEAAVQPELPPEQTPQSDEPTPSTETPTQPQKEE